MFGRIQDVKILAKILSTEPPPSFNKDPEALYRQFLSYLQRIYSKFSGLNISSTIINEAPDVISAAVNRGMEVIAINFETNVSTGIKVYILVPEILNGYNLKRAQASVITAGVTGATTIGIYNVTKSHEMLTGNISIASGQTLGTVGTIDTSYDDVATNDILRIHVDAVSSGTAPKGLNVILEFEKP